MGGLPVIPGLCDALSRLPADSVLPDLWADIAGKVQDNAYHFLGVDWPQQTGLPDWFLDPVTGNRWDESAYCFSIPYRHNRLYGDIKYIWEINRLQYLQPVAALAWITKDAGLSALCARHLMNWIRTNKPYNGINWNSGIELALRSISICFLTTLLPQAFQEEEKKEILACLFAHGYWLHRFPSKYSSANNHLVAEGASLYLLGLALPSHPISRHWHRMGKRILSQQVHKQIYPDGIGVEQSPTYTAFSLEMFLFCAWAGNAGADAFGAKFSERLALAASALRAFVDQNGHYPRIGDDDEGRVLFADFHEPLYLQSMLAAVASICQKPDVAPPVAVNDLRSVVFGVAAPTVLTPGIRIFPHGGYSVVRDVCHNQEVLLAFDHGKLGYLSIAAHGHADALALWLHYGGRPLLVDAGTYLYHAGREWRDHFRSTSAHNTLTLNGQNSSTISGAFNWSQKAKARLTGYCDNLGAWQLSGEHTGYKGRFGVVHQRKIHKESGDSIRIEDKITSRKQREYPVEIGFLLAPDLIAEPQNGSLLVRDDARAYFRLSHQGHLGPSRHQGENTPVRGWYSHAFGSKQPATHIVYAGAMKTGISEFFTLQLLAN
jgi:uncharacterized heparinase superfamily protein